MQGYTPPAYWKPIGEVRRSIDIPVVANGEIWCLDDLKRCQEQTGCSHFMLGRGALAMPSLASHCANYLKSSYLQSSVFDNYRVNEGAELSWFSLIAELMHESRTAAESDRRTLSRVKQWLNYAHHQNQIDWFDSVKRVRDTADLQAMLNTLALRRGVSADLHLV